MSNERQNRLKHNFSFATDCRDGRREFDETFLKDATVHIERMDECCFFIGIDAKGLPPLKLFTGIQEGQWFFNINEDRIDGEFISVRRKARFVSVYPPEKKKKAGA